MPAKIISDYLVEAAPIAGSTATLEVLVAESNHRIANNLSLVAGMLRLQANDLARSGRGFSPEEAVLLLAEVGARIDTVGRLHRLLAQSGGASQMDLRDYLEEIAAAAIHSMSGDRVRLTSVTGSDCVIPAHIALSVGFIVGEAVTNAVKYAHPARVAGTIAMACQRQPDGSTLIRITDDGVGLPEGFDPRRDGGLGFRMMRTIAGQLGAGLTFDGSGMGLSVEIRLPPNRPVSAG